MVLRADRVGEDLTNVAARHEACRDELGHQHRRPGLKNSRNHDTDGSPALAQGFPPAHRKETRDV